MKSVYAIVLSAVLSVGIASAEDVIVAEGASGVRVVAHLESYI
jgi:hypothetical protein